MTPARGLRRSAVGAALVLGLTLAAMTAAAPAAPEPQAADGKLDFQVRLRQSGPLWLGCPVPGAPTACVPWTGSGIVRGLGRVSVSYDLLLGWGSPTCPDDFTKPLTNLARLSVAGRGTLIFTFAEGARCVPFADWLSEPQEFTISSQEPGPLGVVSGRGTREQSSISPVGPATEVWTGTLEMPGHVFDLTAPRLHGAGSKTARAHKRAKSAHVTFRVTATDGADGAVPVSCRPRSGSRFGIGRTTVRCTATDRSGNTGRAAFPVIVRRGR